MLPGKTHEIAIRKVRNSLFACPGKVKRQGTIMSWRESVAWLHLNS